VFLTADRNLSHQQDLSSFDIAIVVLAARSNRLDDLRSLICPTGRDRATATWTIESNGTPGRQDAADHCRSPDIPSRLIRTPADEPN
jgi:hypothetical protein